MNELPENDALGYLEIYNILKKVAHKTRESDGLEDIWSAAMLDPAYVNFSGFDKAYIAIYRDETQEFRRLLYIGNFTEAQQEAYNRYAGDWRSIHHGKLFKHLLNLWETEHIQSYVIADFKNDLQTNPEITEEIGIESGIATALIAAKKVIGFAIVGYKLASEAIERRGAKLHAILNTHELLVNLAGLQIGLFGRYREVQDELTQAQRLSVAAQFALGVVHDIQKAIVPINMNLPQLRRYVEHSLSERESLSTIERSISLIRGIADELLDFAATGQRSLPYNLKYTRVPIIVLINEARALAAIPPSIRFDTTEIPTDLDIEIDKEKIIRVIFNLLKNAKEAIQIKTEQQRKKSPKREIKISASRQENEFVISIQDTGRGIDREKLGMIFNPFYSDKESSVGGYRKSKGYGLGLAVSEMIVAAHGGRISVESTLGEGSQFNIFLPSKSVSQGEMRKNDYA